MSWVRQKVCKTKVPHTPHNEKIFELIARAEKWLHQNTYPNPILKWEPKRGAKILPILGVKTLKNDSYNPNSTAHR